MDLSQPPKRDLDQNDWSIKNPEPYRNISKLADGITIGCMAVGYYDTVRNPDGSVELIQIFD